MFSIGEKPARGATPVEIGFQSSSPHKSAEKSDSEENAKSVFFRVTLLRWRVLEEKWWKVNATVSHQILRPEVVVTEKRVYETFCEWDAEEEHDSVFQIKNRRCEIAGLRLWKRKLFSNRSFWSHNVRQSGNHHNISGHRLFNVFSS